MNQGAVVEVAMFELKEGIAPKAFLAAAEEATGWLRNRPGFLARELLADNGGKWIDLVRWASLDDAHSAADEFMSATETRALLDAIDPATLRMLHPRSVARYD